MKAASVNFPDVLIIQNKYQFKPPLPFSPGSELAGVVKEVGDGVTAFRPGDRVMAFTTYGAFAEEVKTEATRLLPMPAGMDFVTGAAFVLTYATSEHALRDRGALKSRRDAARARRRRRRRPRGDRDRQSARRARDRLRVERRTSSRCAASTAPTTRINYATEDLRERIKALTDGRGVDVVYDPVGGPYTEPALRSIAWRGRLLVVGFAAGEIPKMPLNLTLLKGARSSASSGAISRAASRRRFAGQHAAARPLVRRRQAEAARLADASARASGAKRSSCSPAAGEGQGRGHDGGLASPGPNGRCIRTLSTQRPNLKPAERSVPTRRKPNEACRLIEAALRAVADHGDELR